MELLLLCHGSNMLDRIAGTRELIGDPCQYPLVISYINTKGAGTHVALLTVSVASSNMTNTLFLCLL